MQKSQRIYAAYRPHSVALLSGEWPEPTGEHGVNAVAGWNDDAIIVSLRSNNQKPSKIGFVRSRICGWAWIGAKTVNAAIPMIAAKPT